MKPQSKTSARIWAILAREAPVAVIFRRGPSKQVRLIKWNLRTDEFECGQWFKGRIYERRCDLSPDGKLLIYFASKQASPSRTWTAVSKPPYLTALALWPNGSCWNGGGHFLTNESVVLDHGPFPTELAPGYQLKKLDVTIAPFRMGEDMPVWETTLTRDGWQLTTTGRQRALGLAEGWRLDPPRRWIKSHPKKSLVLQMAIHEIGVKNRHGWYVTRYQVLSNDNDGLQEIEADWADWDRKGNLLYAQDGKIFRLRHSHGKFLKPVELIDLNAQQFENMEAPLFVRRW